VIEMENFVLKKTVEPVEKPKKGEPAIKETTEEQWLPGFLRISQINFIYEISN
jgi:hypothetical protein